MQTPELNGVLASAGLVAGALTGLVVVPPRRLVAAVVAFGSGVLVSALTFELIEEAFAEGSPASAIGGFLLGAVIFVVAGAQHIPQCAEQATVSGTALPVGAALDGIPENAAIGIGPARRWLVSPFPLA